MSPVFVNTVRASFYRFRPDLGGLRVGREILVWRTVLPQCAQRAVCFKMYQNVVTRPVVYLSCT